MSPDATRNIRDLRHVQFLVQWAELKDRGWWGMAPSFGALSDTLARLPVLSITPKGRVWEENSEALGLFVADLLTRLKSSRYTLLLYAEGNLSIGLGDLVPLFPYILHGGPKGRFYLAEALCTDPDQTSGGFTVGRVSFEYDPTQLERIMVDFAGSAFRLDTSFGGAFWPNKKVREGLLFDFGPYRSILTLCVDSPLWFETNRDFDSLTFVVPSPGWRRRLTSAVRATLEAIGAGYA